MDGQSEPTMHVGTKRILASPMTRAAYNDYRGWELPANENGADEGFLVEYLDGGAPNDPRHVGYISWSPADVFLREYRPDGELDFAGALKMLNTGRALARSGWNGKGMFIYKVEAGRYPPSTPTGHSIASEQHDYRVPYGPYLAMKTATGEVVPWLASQTDILASDWGVVDTEAKPGAH